MACSSSAANASGSRKKLVTPISRSRKSASTSAGVLLQIAHVLVQPLDLVDGHAPLDAADDGVLLVLGEVVAGLGAQQDEDLLQRVLGLGRRGSEQVEAFRRSACAT